MITDKDWLNKYWGKDVEIVCVKGQVLTGFVEAVTRAVDDPANEDNVTLLIGDKHVCVYKNEIDTIKII